MKSVIETFKDIPGYEGLYQVSDYGCVRSLKFGKVKYLKNTKTSNGYCQIGLSRDGKQKMFMVHRLVWEAFNGPIPDGLQIDHINTVRDDNRLSNLRVVTPKENNANPISVENHRDSMRRMSQDPKWREAVKRFSQDPKWREAVRESNQRLAKDPKWLEATREANKRRSKDPKWLEANRKAHNKPVLQIDKQTGEVIREWECAADVERELGINYASISACCHGKRNSAGEFKWKFA